MKTNELFPLISKMAASGLSATEALKASFYHYWNLPRGAVSKRGHVNFATHRVRIMSRFHHYHPGELWTVGPPPWTYDLRTPEQSRERQKRDQTTKTIPVVFALMPDPIGSKLVNNLARPEANELQIKLPSRSTILRNENAQVKPLLITSNREATWFVSNQLSSSRKQKKSPLPRKVD